jgi:CspA family cold shock protein
MARGTVKWFSQVKGYGFITAEGEQELFVHHSAIEGSGFRSLSVGQEVEFVVKHSDRGAEASQVTKIH